MSGRNLFQILAVSVFALACLSISGCKMYEHPGKHEKKVSLTKDQLADAIEAYIQKTSAAHGGYFPISDEKTGRQLQLTLVKVHRKKLAKVGPDRYFACVDLKSTEGNLYDVDFFMQGPDKDSLTFSEFMIHKENGRERYTWHEKKGIWTRKPVEAAEHPHEHPR